MTPAQLAILALEHVSKVLKDLTESQLQDLATGRAHFEFRSPEVVIKSPATKKMAPPPDFDVDSVAAEIKALETSGDVSTYLEKKKYKRDALVAIAKSLGPTVSAKGTVAELKRNIAEGTAGFRQRATAVGGWQR